MIFLAQYPRAKELAKHQTIWLWNFQRGAGGANRGLKRIYVCDGSMRH
jgi:hypothetical protein